MNLFGMNPHEGMNGMIRQATVFLAVVVGFLSVISPVPENTSPIRGQNLLAADGNGNNDGNGGNGTGDAPGIGGGGVPQDAWAWTQLTDGGPEFRFVTPATTCPVVLITRVAAQTPERHQMHQVSTGSAFPTTATTCFLRLTGNAVSAQIDTSTTAGFPVLPNANGSVPVPAWTVPGTAVRRPRNIVVIGDTGCRVVSATDFQDCTSATAWPLQQVANSAAATPQLDLVVHTGDYIYRSTTSVQTAPTCGGPGSAPNNVHTWGCLEADFFYPAASLLAQKPIVFMRGNHETCNRNGDVWFRYLASRISQSGCDAYTQPTQIRAGSLSLILFDSSCASEQPVPPDCTGMLANYTAQFDTVNNIVGMGDNFLLTHSPLWAVNGQTGPATASWVDRLLDNALSMSQNHMLSPLVRLVLSGHLHLYEMLSFGTGARPPQIVSGASGTQLDPVTWNDAQLVANQAVVDGLPIGNLVSRSIFGYAVLQDTGTTWNLQFHNQSGATVTGTNCTLSGTQFTGCG
jgi:hypothetical protein